MIKNWKLLILLLTLSGHVFAQKIEVKQVEEKMSQGKQYGLQVLIPRVSPKDVISDWKKWTKNHDAKTKPLKSEYFTDDIFLSGISNNTVDLYATFNDKNDVVEMTVFFDLGGAFLNRGMHADAYAAASTLLHDFAVDEAKDVVEALLSSAVKDFDKLDKENEKLKKDRSELEDNIKAWQKAIDKANKDLKSNEDEQKKLAKAMEDKQKAIDVIKDVLKGIR